MDQTLHKVQVWNVTSETWNTVATTIDEPLAIQEADYCASIRPCKYRVLQVETKVCYETNFKQEETATQTK